MAHEETCLSRTHRDYTGERLLGSHSLATSYKEATKKKAFISYFCYNSNLTSLILSYISLKY